MLTLKSLAYFGDGDLRRLTAEQKARLTRLATQQNLNLPNVPRIAGQVQASPS